jgi:hypothetical protein
MNPQTWIGYNDRLAKIEEYLKEFADRLAEKEKEIAEKEKRFTDLLNDQVKEIETQFRRNIELHKEVGRLKEELQEARKHWRRE